MRNYHSRFTCNTKSVRLTCQLHANRYAYRPTLRPVWCFGLPLPTPTQGSADYSQHYTDKNANQSHTQWHLERFTRDLRAHARKNRSKQVSGVFRFRWQLFGTESTRTRRTTLARTDTLTNARASTNAQLAQGTPDAALTAIGNTRHSHTRSKCVALEASALSWENEDAIGGGENSLVRGMRTSFSHNIPKEG